MIDVLINSLKPHPQNNLIYGDSFDDDLFQSIKKHGLTSPITISPDSTIISGHRRWNVCKALRHEVVPVQEIDETDPDKLVEILIASNVQREKSKEQKAREVKMLKAIEDKRAKDRQVESGENFGKGSKVKENFPEPIDKGQSRDIAAAKVGWSGKTAEQAIAVVDAIDALKETDPTQAKELTKDLNKSVSGAYKKVTQKKEGGKEDEAARKIRQRAEKKAMPEAPVLPVEKYVNTCTHAMQFAVIAISQLSRIRPDDPKKLEALDRAIS